MDLIDILRYFQYQHHKLNAGLTHIIEYVIIYMVEQKATKVKTNPLMRRNALVSKGMMIFVVDIDGE